MTLWDKCYEIYTNARDGQQAVEEFVKKNHPEVEWRYCTACEADEPFEDGSCLVCWEPHPLTRIDSPEFTDSDEWAARRDYEWAVTCKTCGHECAEDCTNCGGMTAGESICSICSRGTGDTYDLCAKVWRENHLAPAGADTNDPSVKDAMVLRSRLAVEKYVRENHPSLPWSRCVVCRNDEPMVQMEFSVGTFPVCAVCGFLT